MRGGPFVDEGSGSWLQALPDGDRVMAHQLGTTNWTLILRAEASDADVRRAAMAELSDAYWYPLYLFARRRGFSHDDASDLTQAFFVHLIGKHALRGLDRVQVRFRPYLLTAFKNFESDVRDRKTALKRGGGQLHVTFDPAVLERRYVGVACGEENPERLYIRQWAVTVLERARERLRSAYCDAGKAHAFEILSRHLVSGRDEAPISEVAQALDVSAGAARIALHRLRRRFGAELRAEVACTVDGPDQVEAELRFLLAVLSEPAN
jgi:DNA-directed RNA polymerase specialized sigma24 family protein